MAVIIRSRSPSIITRLVRRLPDTGWVRYPRRLLLVNVTRGRSDFGRGPDRWYVDRYDRLMSCLPIDVVRTPRLFLHHFTRDL